MLKQLSVNDNLLTILPPALSQKQHYFLVAKDNFLIYPPQHIADQGSEATLEFLRHPRAYPPYEPGAGLAWVVGTWAVVLALTLRGIRWYVRRLG
jgi:hypothetical protein